VPGAEGNQALGDDKRGELAYSVFSIERRIFRRKAMVSAGKGNFAQANPILRQEGGS
jgi:hypothetical protein